VLIRLFSFLAQFLSGQKSYATKRQPFSIYCEKFGLMPTTDELQIRSLTELAVLCNKVVEDPSQDPTAADEARKLKREWTALQAPSPSSFEKAKKIEGKKEKLKQRMAEFLAQVLD
jgi:hypothetical protein